MKKNKGSWMFVFFTLFIVLGLVSSNLAVAASPASVNLGSAGNFTVLAKTGISTTGTTSIVGDIGVSPAEATYITGFDLILPAAGAYSTSSLVTGKVYAPSYATPTPANISTAVSDMETAYTDGAGRSLNAITELGAGNIGGLTLAPGLYKWGTGVTIPTDVTLSGSANDVWIFIVAQNLDISSAKSVVLAGGAKANNVFWIVAGQTTIGTGATFNGNILDQTAIVLNTGAVLNGRALAQTAVTLDASAVTLPSGSSSNSNSNSSSNLNSNAATPAIPATPAVPGVSSAIPATPAVPAILCSNGKTVASNCSTDPSAENKIVTTTYNLGTSTLKFGSQGESVKELQKFLNSNLNRGLAVDGILGPKTTAVIKEWQKGNGLNDDGRVGELTKIKMNATN